MFDFRKQSVIGSVVLLICGIAVAGEASAEFNDSGYYDRAEAKYQIGLTTDFRLDGLGENSYVPSLGGRFYYFFHPTVALCAGMTHNSFTRLSTPTGYHTVAADVALRFNFPKAHVTPYLETGLWLPYFWGVDQGYAYDDFHPGARFAGGLSVVMAQGVVLDLSVSQVVNHLKNEIIWTSPMPPYGSGSFRPFHDPYGAYNETRVELGVRFGL